MEKSRREDLHYLYGEKQSRKIGVREFSNVHYDSDKFL